jgi:hypothetical protein
MQAAVDKEEFDRVGLGGRFADEYLAAGFGERKGEHIGDMVLVLVLPRNGEHLLGRQKGDRQFVPLAQDVLFYLVENGGHGAD